MLHFVSCLLFRAFPRPLEARSPHHTGKRAHDRSKDEDKTRRRGRRLSRYGWVVCRRPPKPPKFVAAFQPVSPATAPRRRVLYPPRLRRVRGCRSCHACGRSCICFRVRRFQYSLLGIPLAEELHDALVGDLLNVRRERGHFECCLYWLCRACRSVLHQRRVAWVEGWVRWCYSLSNDMAPTTHRRHPQDLHAQREIPKRRQGRGGSWLKRLLTRWYCRR